MKRIVAVIMIIGLLFSAFAEVSKPSLDGRAKVADVGELPVGLFAKSASFLPGDTVIVTNPATKISIEVMIFGNIGSSEGIAVVLSPEAARELYITKGSNVIVQVTKKGDTYEESSILAKTLQTYTPEAVEEEDVTDEPVFDTPSEAADEDFYFYSDPDSVIEQENPELTQEPSVDETEYVSEMDTEIDGETSLEPPESEIAFEEPEWPAEEIDVEPEPVEPVEEVAFVEPEWPAEVVETEPEPFEPAEEVAFEEPDWPAEEVEGETTIEPAAEEIAFVEPEWSEEAEPVIEYVEVAEEEALPEENGNFIEETEIALIPADPNPPVYEDMIQDEPEVVIIPIFEESSDVAQNPVIIEEEPEVAWADVPAIEEEPEVVIEPEIIAEEEPLKVEVPASIPFGEIKSGNWYIQIATCSKLETVENLVSQYGKKYPLLIVKTEAGDMRVLVGSLSADEYPTILARFKALGFKDAFARNK